MTCNQVLAPPVGVTHMPAPPVPADAESSCCDSISIDNWDEMPQGIEITSQPLFCVLDADNNILGRTFLCKVIDEETRAETFTKMVSMVGASAPEIYDPATHGAESVCDPKDDCSSTVSGLTGWG